MFIFDKHLDEGHRGILDWIRRSIIIEGVGRGLLYLHKDSRLKIIDRDLKPSNILLDNNFNPKISDFVMARIFGSDQDQADTRRVVVAEFSSGYMAPEYATGRKILSGKRKRFSDKSDVFSFGVLVLKIISGRKSTISWNETSSLSLLRYVRLLLNANFQKTALTENTHSMEVMERRRFIKFRRSIHIESKHENGDQKMHAIGLLCVQEFAEDRPSISSILVILTTETTSLPAPLQPAFTERQRVCFFRMRNENRETRFTLNNISITNLTGR
ncbi:hypothetical protein T459_14271 [Capsicum annuum]|uniref:non-specific serine/threonine protein kinase n=1 Tax=Capsicum annuum TaxID=4072 RepID=A0A2G2ZGY7_CAPAN|nr:hypothetical protein T459_14271 [Capsicum annuum]